MGVGKRVFKQPSRGLRDRAEQEKTGIYKKIFLDRHEEGFIQ